MNYRLIVALLLGLSILPAYRLAANPDSVFSPEELLTIAKKADNVVSSAVTLSEEEALLLTNYFYFSYMLIKSDRIARLHLNALSNYYKAIKTDVGMFVDMQDTIEKLSLTTQKLKNALQLRNRIFDLCKFCFIKFEPTDITTSKELKATFNLLATQYSELSDMFLTKHDSDLSKKLLSIHEKLTPITGELQSFVAVHKDLSTGKSQENPNEKLTPLAKFYSAMQYSLMITNDALHCLESAEDIDTDIIALNNAETIIHAMHYNKMIQSLAQRKITPFIMTNSSGEIPAGKRTEKLPEQIKI